MNGSGNIRSPAKTFIDILADADGASGPAKGFRDHAHLGNFSLDENRNYCNDDRNRQFFVAPGPRPAFDLLQGHADFIHRRHRGHRDDDGIEIKSVDVVLQWVRDHVDELEHRGMIASESSGSKSMSVDFVTRRGALHDLLRSAHHNDRFMFLVALHRGTYYLEQVEILSDRENPNDPERIQMFSGKKFAQYCTTKSSGTDPDPTVPINDNLSYEAVMAATCGDFKLMFSTEIHAELAQHELIPVVMRPPRHHNYVNIRTTREFNGERDIQQSKTFFRNRLFQWWSQNHIAGIPRVILGWRDDTRHVITRVETYNTEDIPNIQTCPWKTSKYFEVIQRLLTDITREIRTDDARAVYSLELEKIPSAPYALLARQLSERTFKIEKLTDGHRIVKDWFVTDVLKAK